MGEGLVLGVGEKTMARQQGVVGRGLEVRAKVKALPHHPSMCSIYRDIYPHDTR